MYNIGKQISDHNQVATALLYFYQYISGVCYKNTDKRRSISIICIKVFVIEIMFLCLFFIFIELPTVLRNYCIWMDLQLLQFPVSLGQGAN